MSLTDIRGRGNKSLRCSNSRKRTVHDPEIPVNKSGLRLIYDTERLEDGNVRILMTLTANACPVINEMPYDYRLLFLG